MKPVWATFEFFTFISTQIFRDLLNCPHWFPGHLSWLIFFRNFKNSRFCRPTDFTDHIIVTPFSMFNDNSAQSFRKTWYELIKTTNF